MLIILVDYLLLAIGEPSLEKRIFQTGKLLSRVILKIYDVLGSEVLTLVKEELGAGNHKTVFDATRYSSGINFYQIKAGDFIQTKKMILIK
jgi:hypothetical protein